MLKWQSHAPLLISVSVVIVIITALLYRDYLTVQALSMSTTSVEVIMSCGDGSMDFGEVCDAGQPPLIPPDFNGATCIDYGYASGYLVCTDECMRIDTGQCYTCGNGSREAVEECDGGDYGGRTCLTYGYNAGILSCTGSCLVNLAGCFSTGLEGGSLPTQGGGGGGGGPHGGGATAGLEDGRDTPLPDTRVLISGKAYSNAVVNVLKEGEFRGTAQADSKAAFTFEDKGVMPGVASYSFWAQDKNKIKSSLYTITFQVSSYALTTVTGAYLAPTITSDKVTLKKGEEITIFGETIPEASVFVSIHSPEEILEKTTSDDDGEWRIYFDTERLVSEETHTAKAYFQSTENGIAVKSGESKLITFSLGEVLAEGACAKGDLNQDKKTNLTDFSILLYHWSSANACADQNHDGTVNLVDFSIMMFNWTG